MLLNKIVDVSVLFTMINLDKLIYPIHLFASLTIFVLFCFFELWLKIQTGCRNWLWSVYCEHFRSLLILLIPLDELCSFRIFFLPLLVPLCCAAAEVKPWEPSRTAVGTWTRVRIAANAIRFMTCETLHLMVVMKAKCEGVVVLLTRSVGQREARGARMITAEC